MMRRRLALTVLFACAALASAGGSALAGSGSGLGATVGAHSRADGQTRASVRRLASFWAQRAAAPALRASLRGASWQLERKAGGRVRLSLRLSLWVSRPAGAILKLTLARSGAARAHLGDRRHARQVTIGLGSTGLRSGTNRLLVLLGAAISRRLEPVRALAVAVRVLVADGPGRLALHTVVVTS
jgi:hypothetical protein